MFAIINALKVLSIEINTQTDPVTESFRFSMIKQIKVCWAQCKFINKSKMYLYKKKEKG